MCRYYINNRISPQFCRNSKIFSKIDIESPVSFHRTLKQYDPTSLESLPGLAKSLKLKRLYVKDESTRFGLSAFKGLGASFAIFDLLCKDFQIRGIESFSLARLDEPEIRTLLSGITFCTATDGNHGRAVAWMASLLGANAVIFMPKNSAKERVDSIKVHGATVTVIDGHYDDAVDHANTEAGKHNWHIISDTSTIGREQTTAAISAGYFTLFHEIDEQLSRSGDDLPEFIFIQSGVGALAAAAGVYYARTRPDNMPCLISVEPTQAACLLESVASERQLPQKASGNLKTIMAGLNCGTPSPLAFEIIKSSFALFLAIRDQWAERAMRQFYRPGIGDRKIESGESGAAGLAGCMALVESRALKGIAPKIGLNRDSSVLIINTEGITDRAGFDRILSKEELDS